MNLAKEVKHAGKSVKVFYDPDPLNPRKEYDNATIMLHWHRRYDLGDKRIERMSKEEVEAQYEEEGDPILAILPLYLYDHSGLSISTGGFSCRFDSGQVGYVYITKSKADEMGWDLNNPPNWEDIIKGEVKTYDDYLTGQVFGYEVVGRDGETLESCWGFIGDIDDCLSEGKSAAEGCEDPADARDAEELAGRATYAGVPQ